MQIFQFGRQGEIPLRLDAIDALPHEGFVWLDFTRQNAAEWPSWVKRLTGVVINEEHVNDSFNGDHMSTFEDTEDYDMLIFQALTPEECESTQHLIVTKSAAFFIFERLLVTVRAAENVSFDVVKRKFCETKLRFPSTPFGFVHVVLDTMVNRYLTVTDELEDRLERIGDKLMDPKDGYHDWRELMRYRKQAHGLEILCEKNLDTINAWQSDVRGEITESQRIRLADLRQHIERVARHADAIQRDIEIAVQLHFASVSHKTNEVVRSLTVLSAIFFPLTLLTGIWGMNFEHMPELSWKYGYAFALTTISVVGISLMIYFKRRRIL
ncbi:MAG: magnesium transporter CorA family protein [Stagnimonas sp.]|nr:magnesium transporter CorA family protein [Stagnimonas sp.]